ncbi:hypothetical protein ABIE06_001719 [Pantoea dispersa]|uniref:tail fiber assembly protein n=1 Tax=Pantoea dispersa TaxID=59814 RepID=UPI003D1BC67F
MAAYAIIDQNGNVINTAEWDGENDWVAPEGTTLIALGDSGAGIGWTYKDGLFTSPPAPVITKAELVAQAQQVKLAMMDDSSQKISVLQDAVELEMATDDEKTQLAAWKKYRVLLNRVDTATAPDISWPTEPQ